MKQNLIIVLIVIFIFTACQDIITSADDLLTGNKNFVSGEQGSVYETITVPKRIGFNDFPRAIQIPEVTPERAAVYHYDAIGDFISGYQQDDMSDTLNGYITDNYDFYEQILYPILAPYVDSLKTLQKYQALNCITLFIQESYQNFFGLGYYRWGGDITDRDQPQTATSHSTSKKRFGMDCSGFGASPYEVAVLLGVLDSTQNESAFSSFGFKHICENDPNISDGGGRGGTTNNFRMEVSDMYKVGRLITSIPSGSAPTDAQIALMQAGDVVLKSGHMGILVEINEHLYFLESGGSTLREDGLYTPYLAKDALAHFAQSRTTSIRRCLPNLETSSGIARY